MIAIRALGPAEVIVDGAPPQPELLWKKNLALLVYLARSPHGTRAREHLVGLLWADKPDKDARHSLREAIRALRRAAGDAGLTTSGEHVTLTPDVVTLDLAQFDAAFAARDWSTAAALANGDFLEGFTVPDAAEFEHWLAQERAAWRTRAVEALARSGEHELRRGDVAAALTLTDRAHRLDRTAESPLRVAMRALALSGNRAAAIGRYDAIAADLAELGTAPAEETQQLVELIRRERTWRLSGEVPKPDTSGAELKRAPLIGRAIEMERLVEAWNTCRTARMATAMVVEADAGAGKTRLVEELVARARLDGGTTATVRAVAVDRETPNAGVLGLAGGGLLDARGLTGANPSALATIGGHVAAWEERFGTGEGSLTSAFNEIVAAITAEQPLLLVVDDAHWMDAETLHLFSALLRNHPRAPLAIVLTSNRNHMSPEVDELRTRLGRDVAGIALQLTPLAVEALRELAHWAVPEYTDEQLDRLVRRLAHDSAGLPLLAVEILHAVALGLQIGAADEAWPAPFRTLDQTLPGDLPDTVIAAIRIGFRRLSTDAQSALAAAACVGPCAPEATIERATELTRARVAVALDELEWQRWLTADARGYSFVAGIVRDVVLRDMVTAGARERYRARAASV